MAFEICTSSLNNELILANFSNGRPINNDVLSNIKLYQHEKNPKSKILTMKTERLEYKGSNVGPHSIRPSTDCKQYVGILDKRTNKMHIMGFTWFNMKPTLLGLDNVHDQEAEQKPEDIPGIGSINKERLTMSFGSRRKQKGIEMRQRLQVDKSDISTTLQNTIDSIQTQESNYGIEPCIQEANLLLDEILPPINREATAEKDVYNIQDIVSNCDLADLEKPAMVLADGTANDIENWITNKTYANFVLKNLKSIPLDQVARLEKCKLLIYYNYLVSLMSIRAGKVKEKDFIALKIPADILKGIKIKYFKQPQENQGNSKRVTLYMSDNIKEKLIVHIIILALLIDNFATSVEPVQQDLKLRTDRFKLMVRVCGARLVKVQERKKQTEIISLELPLAEIDMKSLPIAKKY